jgi:hypothetical protein
MFILVVRKHICIFFIGSAVLRSRIRMFLGLLDTDPVVRGTDTDLDPAIIKQK